MTNLVITSLLFEFHESKNFVVSKRTKIILNGKRVKYLQHRPHREVLVQLQTSVAIYITQILLLLSIQSATVLDHELAECKIVVFWNVTPCSLVDKRIR